MLQGFGAPPAAPALDMRALAAAFGQQQQQQQPRVTRLTDVVDAEQVEPALLGDEAAVAALLPLLPPGLQTKAELAFMLRSPQLRQALGALGAALQTDNFNAVMSNFGLDPMAGAAELQVREDPFPGHTRAAAQADRGHSPGHSPDERDP
jgi:hypothetical protein